MSLEGILVGVVAIVIGLAWAFYGFKAFLILLPIWAFLVGFCAGASWIQQLFGDGFLATTTSWVGGLVIGIVLAVLSYFWYYAAIVIVGGALGYTLGAGVLAAIGFGDFISFAGGLLGRIQLEDISSGLGEGLLKDPLIAVVGTIVIAAAGIMYQMRDLSDTAQSIRREGYRI